MNVRKNGVNLIICIVIFDNSGSVVKHLRSNELLYQTFIIQSAGEGICKIGKQLAKLWAE